MENSEVGSSRGWRLLGNNIPKSEIVFFVQVILIYGVVITSLVNISLGDTQELWVVLLTSCLGYLMPSPSLKQNHHHVHDSPQ
jgi:hypothetical protein